MESILFNQIHRDLKPENIFFSSDVTGTAKIGDFGITRREIMDGSGEERSSVITYSTGTQLYMAPKQKLTNNRNILTRKVDIYAMGMILFELFYQYMTFIERKKIFDDLHLEQPKFPADTETKIGNEAKEVSGVIKDYSSSIYVIFFKFVLRAI